MLGLLPLLHKLLKSPQGVRVSGYNALAKLQRPQRFVSSKLKDFGGRDVAKQILLCSKTIIKR